jgi:hypothetical protein
MKTLNPTSTAASPGIAYSPSCGRGGATPEVIALTVSRARDLGETDTSEAREIRASLRVLSDLHGMGGAVEDKIGRYPGSA